MIHHDWHLTPERVAIHLPTATAVVADLHLGYHEARQQNGDAIPLVDVDTQLAPLLWVLKQGQVKSVVIAGDLFEKSFDLAIWQTFHTQLTRMGVQFLGLIPGNHDRNLDNAPAELTLLPEGLLLGKWRILHGDEPWPNLPVVLGHFHPCIFHRGRKIPCYFASDNYLVLPAYSKEAAGVVPDKRWQNCRRLGIIAGKVMGSEWSVKGGV